MADDDEIRIRASLDNDLSDETRKAVADLSDLEDALDDAGKAGERAGDRIEGGAEKASTATSKLGKAADDTESDLDELNRTAERTAKQMSDMTKAGAAAAATLDDVGDEASDAARELGETATGAAAASKALGGTERQARQTARALDEAGDEATAAGAKAAASATFWERLSNRLDRHDRIARRWAALQDGMRWSTWTSRADRFAGAMGNLFMRTDWGGAAKKIDKVSKAFGGMKIVMMTIKFGGIIGGVYALVGLLSALAAGAIGAAGGLGSLVPALGAVGGLFLAAKVGMKVFQGALKEATEETEKLSAQFDYASAVLDGGLRKGLQGFTKDSEGFAKVFRQGMAGWGESYGMVLESAGAYVKLGDTQSRLAQTLSLMQPILVKLGETFINVFDSVQSAVLGVLPVVDVVATDVQGLTADLRDNMREWQSNGAITRVTADAYDRLKRTMGIVVDFAKGIFRIFRIGAQESGWMADSIERLARRFQEWTGSTEGQNAIRKYFQDAMPAIRETGLLIGDLFRLFAGAATHQDMAPMIRMIRTELLPALASLMANVGPGMIQFFTTLLQIISQLDFSPLVVLINVLNGVASAVLWLMTNIPGFSTLLSILLTTMALLGPGAFIIAKIATAFGILRTVIFNVQVAMALLKVVAPGMWAALTGPVGWVIGIVMALVAVFIYLYNNCEWFRDAVHVVLRAVGGFFVWLWDQAVAAFGGIVDFVVGAATWIGNALVTTGDWFVWLGGVVGDAMAAIGQWISDQWNGWIKPTLDAIGYVLKFIGAIIFVVFVMPFIFAFKALAALFTWWWETITWPILKAVADGFVWLWENAIKPAIDWIVGAWNWLGEQLDWVNTAIIQPGLRMLGEFVRWLYDTFIKPVVDAAIWAWDMLGAGIAWVNTNIIQPGLQMLGDFINWVWTTLIQPVIQWFVDRWNDLGLAIQFVWVAIIQPAIQAWADRLAWLNTSIVQPILGWIQERWADLGTGIEWVRANVIDPVMTAIATSVNWVKDRFADAVDGIRNIWNGLRNALAVPTNFLIETVWNGGILPVWNWVAEKIGLPLGKELNKIPEFATGGPIRGAGTGTSDSMVARVSNGEHVLTAEDVDNMGGHQGVLAMRQMARDRKLRQRLAMFAEGGPVTPQEMHGAVAAALPGTRLTSGFRPGDPGYHGKNRAADLAGARSMDTAHMRKIDEFIGTKFPGSAQLIFTPGPYNLLNGSPHTYNAATRADHHDHVHWANNGSAAGEGGGWIAGAIGAMWDTAKPALDAIINPVIDGIPFHGPPQFLDIPKRMAITGRDELYKWAEVELNKLADWGEGIAAGIDAFAAQAQVKAAAVPFGWSTGREWDAILKLVQGESGWRTDAANPTSSARGLFQKMTSLHGPVESTAFGQGLWGLNYIKGAYGTPSNALAKWSSRSPHWYDDGGMLPPGLSMVMNGTGQPEPVFTAPQWDNISGVLDATGDLVAPQSGRGDDELLEAIHGLSTAVMERPPPISAAGEDVRKEVLAAIRQDRREREAKGRYTYGGKR